MVSGVSRFARIAMLSAGLCALAAGARFLQNASDKAADTADGAFADSAMVLLGGFRGILSEIVWFQADRLEAAGEYSQLSQVAATLTHLEPHTPEVWEFAAWNLAFNISASMPSDEERWRWVSSGIDLLRKDALAINHRNPSISRTLAEIYLMKVAVNLDDSAPYYRQRLRNAFETGGVEALGLEPQICRAVESKYGAQDWGTAEAHALYWADSALEGALAKGRARGELLQQIFQALLFEYKRDSSKKAPLVQVLRTLRTEYPAPYLDDCAKALGVAF